jgi:hypothetical protein
MGSVARVGVPGHVLSATWIFFFFFWLLDLGFCQFTAGRIGVARAFPVHASSLGVQFGFELSHDPLLLCLHIICQVSSYPCYTFLYGSRLLIDILFNLELLCLSSL